MSKRVWMAVGMMVAGAGMVLGAEGPAATSPATAAATRAAATETAWSGALDDLASEDFATRERGQKTLGKATFKDRKALQALANAATDNEVKSRLLQRVEELEEQAATDPPPVSVDLKDASFSDVIEGLNKSGEFHFSTNGNPRVRGRMAVGPARYTLKAVDRPFWEVFLALSAQGAMSFRGYPGNELTEAGPGITTGRVSGPFLFYPGTVTYTNIVDPQAPPDAPPREPSLMFVYGVMIDPRVRVVSYTAPVLTSVVDDRGTELMPAVRPVPVMSQINQPQVMFESNTALQIVPGGKKIVSAKGVVRFTVATVQDRVEIADMSKQVNTPIVVGGRSITFTQFAVAGNTITLNANMSNGAAGANGAENRPVEVSLLNSDDALIYSVHLQGGWSGGVGGNIAGPVKGVFTVPTKMKEIQVPFEFKDIPLPLP